MADRYEDRERERWERQRERERGREPWGDRDRDREDPARRAEWEDRERDWDSEDELQEPGPDERRYGPYGLIDYSRRGISIRERNAGRRMSLFGTGRAGWGTHVGRGGSYSSGMTAHSIRGRYTGRGPRGWHRSDERILEDINERLTEHPDIDASDIEVRVENGEVTLTGMVESRQVKHMAEDVAEEVLGVRDVHNQLRLQPQTDRGPEGAPGR